MSQRTEKVESLIKQTLAKELAEELSDGRITVTATEVSPDLRQATVWISILAAADDRQALLDSVQERRGDFQAALGAVMTTKFTPKLSFKLDTGNEYAAHINQLLANTKEKP